MKTKLPPALERKVVISRDDADDETRTVRAALSSELPVQRAFGSEVLVHTPRAINLERAADNGLPLLVNHNDGALPIGRVRNIGLDGDRVLRGDLEFSEATEASRNAWDLARDGTLSDVSIRYSINKHKVTGRDSDNPQYRVTDWTLLEASVVSVPADASVGIGRQIEDHGGTQMLEDEGVAKVPRDPVTAARAATSASENAGAQLERERYTTITSLADNFRDSPTVAELARHACETGTSVADFKEQLIVALSGTPAEPLARSVPQDNHITIRTPRPFSATSLGVQAGETDGEKFARGIEQAFDVRAGNIPYGEAKDNPYTGYSLVEVARMSLERSGLSTRGMSPMDVAGAVLTRYIEPGTANLATTDFPAILENVLNKSLFRGFDEAPVSWNQWCGTGSSRDFKPGTRPGVSQFTSLEVVAENGAVQDGIVTDKKEAFQVETYARKFSVTRQTIVNDDLGGLGDIAAKMGGAAGRTVDEQVYAFVEANGVMVEDGLALFHASHNNLDVTVDQVPSVTAISASRVAMGRQVDWNSVVLGIVPQYMICPLEQEEAMLVLRTTEVDPDAANLTRNNVYRQLWTPVSTPRLSDPLAWYMFGARGEHIDVIFLNGAQRPMLARDEGWTVLAAHWRVVLDFDVMAVDWRGARKITNQAV